ncbi:ankyrin repeat-containing domain protein [Trichoderma austrokoningii]
MSHWPRNGCTEALTGANPNALGGQGYPLTAASSYGHDELVRLLVNHGADISAKQGYYGSMLTSTSATGRQYMIQSPQDNGADVNAEGPRQVRASGRCSRRLSKDCPTAVESC